MTTWARRLLDFAVILPTLCVLVLTATAAFVQHHAATMPRAPGIWAFRPPIHFPLEAIVPPPWETKLEEGEIGPARASPVPIWNQNRTGDLFVAALLSLVLPWVVSQFLHTFPAKLWSHMLMKLN